MDIREYYMTTAGGGRHESEPRIDIVADMIPDSHSMILDLGCYDGEVSKLYKKHTNTVFGADIHSGPLQEAEKSLDGVFEINLDSDWTAIPSESFDIVVMSAVLEHVFDYNNVFSEIRRVLKPEGAFVHATPNAASLRSRIELLRGDVPFWFKNFEHIRLWTRSWVIEKLSDYGLEEEYFTGCYVRRSALTMLHGRLFPTFAPIIVQRFRKAHSREKAYANSPPTQIGK